MERDEGGRGGWKREIMKEGERERESDQVTSLKMSRGHAASQQ